MDAKTAKAANEMIAVFLRENPEHAPLADYRGDGIWLPPHSCKEFSLWMAANGYADFGDALKLNLAIGDSSDGLDLGGTIDRFTLPGRPGPAVSSRRGPGGSGNHYSGRWDEKEGMDMATDRTIEAIAKLRELVASQARMNEQYLEILNGLVEEHRQINAELRELREQLKGKSD